MLSAVMLSAFILSAFMLSNVTQSAVMLSAAMLSAAMLSAVMLSVAAPWKPSPIFSIFYLKKTGAYSQNLFWCGKLACLALSTTPILV